MVKASTRLPMPLLIRFASAAVIWDRAQRGSSPVRITPIAAPARRHERTGLPCVFMMLVVSYCWTLACTDLRLLHTKGDRLDGPHDDVAARLHLQQLHVQADLEGFRLAAWILQGEQPVAGIDHQHLGVGLDG